MSSAAAVTSPAPVRIALAGLSHDHVFWILRHLTRPEVTVVGVCEPDRELADRYAAQFGFAPELIYTDLATMLEPVKPAAVAAFGSTFAHLAVVEVGLRSPQTQFRDCGLRKPQYERVSDPLQRGSGRGQNAISLIPYLPPPQRINVS